ncbi:hypothetical protein [Geoglobus acetivorans]|uniref:Uncharacterized protein n=1 Tax=Geoglobus acetivorans TaxID=565033 RepID=A0A0A7GJX7_GEOAI|nr:hypothetical protein GACE_2210 [Geoglobus acetivorans]
MSLKTDIRKFLKLLRFREVKVGLLMLVFAAVLALISMYPSYVGFSLSGSLEKHDVMSVNEMLPSGDLRSGKVVLRSNYSKIVISSTNATIEETFTGEKILDLTQSRLKISVVEGAVDYTLTGSVVRYPYSLLGYLALVLMVSGSIIANIGLMKIFSEL